MKSRNVLIVLFYLFTLASCTVFKETVYFQEKDPQKEIPVNIPKNSNAAHRIDFGDVFSLTFSLPLQTAPTVAGSAAPLILTVKADSTIEIPTLGKINIVGLTISEANQVILQKAKEYYNHPFVNLLFISFRVTILGEVGAPGIKIINTENATFLDVLAIAGDIKDFGNRQNIKLIRGDSTYLLDITQMEIMKAEAFKVQSNDIIYVQPLRKKVILTNFQTFSAFLTVLTFISSLTTTVLYLTR